MLNEKMSSIIEGVSYIGEANKGYFAFDNISKDEEKEFDNFKKKYDKFAKFLKSIESFDPNRDSKNKIKTVCSIAELSGVTGNSHYSADITIYGYGDIYKDERDYEDNGPEEKDIKNWVNQMLSINDIKASSVAVVDAWNGKITVGVNGKDVTVGKGPHIDITVPLGDEISEATDSDDKDEDAGFTKITKKEFKSVIGSKKSVFLGVTRKKVSTGALSSLVEKIKSDTKSFEKVMRTPTADKATYIQFDNSSRLMLNQSGSYKFYLYSSGDVSIYGVQITSHSDAFGDTDTFMWYGVLE